MGVQPPRGIAKDARVPVWTTQLVRMAGSICLCWSMLGSLLASFACAQTPSSIPLHARIDELLRTDTPLLTAETGDEGQLLRKLSLDLRNCVPTGEEIEAYVSDSSPDRWAKTVEAFMSDPLHAERMVDWLDKTLMQRRPNTQVDRNAWTAYLRQCIADRSRIDSIITAMFTAPWWDNSQRPALRFFLDRTGDPHLITRDIGRVFLGRDLQCAQCHDHPLVDDYRQVDYHGLLAFVSNSTSIEATYKNEKGQDTKTQIYVEKPGADAPFESVFEKGVLIRTGPRLPGGREIIEAYELPDQRLAAELPAGAFAAAPKPPKSSRRSMLASELVQRNSRALAKNFANRLWAMVFGRGLVHPLDMHHPDNPPSNPKLMECLTDGFLELEMDADRFVRELVLTQAYRRSGRLSSTPWPIDSAVSPDTYAKEYSDLATRLSSQVETWNTELKEREARVKAGEESLESARKTWREAQVARNAIRVELDKAETAFNDQLKKIAEADKARDAAQKKHEDAKSRVSLLDEAAAKLDQALKLLPAEDPEIKQALSVAKAKAEAGRGELPGLGKAVEEKLAASQAALAAIEAPRTKVLEVAAQHKASSEALVALEDKLTTARENWRNQQIDALSLEEMIRQSEKIISMCKSLESARSLLTQQSEGRTLIANTTKRVEVLAAEMIAATEQFKILEGQHAESQARVEAAKKALAQHDAQRDQLIEARKQLEQSLVLVDPNDSLLAAIKTLDGTLASKSVARGELEKVVNEASVGFLATSEKRQVSKQELGGKQSDLDKAKQALQAAQESLTKLQTTSEEAIEEAKKLWSDVLELREQNLTVAPLRPMSPEQLGLSILRVTGAFSNSIQGELAELNKAQPLAEGAEASVVEARQAEAVRKAMEKQRGNLDAFARLYASGVGQTADDFFASPDQALFMSNGGSVYSWAGANNKNITSRIIANTKDDSAAVHDLYRTLLARTPTQSELEFVLEQLNQAGNQRAAIAQELVWAVLSGAEFRFYR